MCVCVCVCVHYLWSPFADAEATSWQSGKHQNLSMYLQIYRDIYVCVYEQEKIKRDKGNRTD